MGTASLTFNMRLKSVGRGNRVYPDILLIHRNAGLPGRAVRPSLNFRCATTELKSWQ